MSTTGTSQLQPGSRIDHFQLSGLLGKGGMGSVYLAEDTNLGRKVAIKLLSPILLETPGYRERFFREARSAARLNHPNIVGIFHLGEVAGLPYFAMEYVEGRGLDQVVSEDGPMAPSRALELMIQVVDGLEHAKTHGIIHRDLKPANLFLGQDDRVRILDFGLARAEDNTSMTATGAIMGTPDFMAPEQGLGKKVTMAADVYAVGVILFRFLSGRLPFEGDSALEVMMSHVQVPPPNLAKLYPHLPVGLVQVVDRCLEKAPEDRYSTYPELRAALVAAQGLVQGFPASAPAPGLAAAAKAATLASSPRPAAASAATAVSHGATVPRTLVPESLGAPAKSPPALAPKAQLPVVGSTLPDAYDAAPVRYLPRALFSPLQARDELVSQPAPEWPHLAKTYGWFSSLLVVGGLMQPSLVGFHSALVLGLLWLLFLTPMTWIWSKLLSRNLGGRQAAFLSLWTLAPLALATLPLAQVLGLLLAPVHFFAHIWWMLSARSKQVGAVAPTAELPEAAG